MKQNKRRMTLQGAKMQKMRENKPGRGSRYRTIQAEATESTGAKAPRSLLGTRGRQCGWNVMSYEEEKQAGARRQRPGEESRCAHNLVESVEIHFMF